MAIAYLNGDWMAPEEARVSVFDRGFMFGDGIYEVMAVYDGTVFMLEKHLTRLQRSLDAIRLVSPFSPDGWRTLINEAVVHGMENPAYLYLQVTRGVESPRSHVYPQGAPPTVLITVMAAPELARKEVQPYRVVTKSDIRWSRGDIKVTSLVANGLLRNEAVQEGYDDAILLRDGLVTEATAANVFIVKDGTIITPPRSNHLLHGITRDHIIDLVQSAGMPFEERPVTGDELLAADEIWISSTGHEVWPVGEVNGRPIGNGEPGVLWQVVDDLFQQSKRS